MTSAGEGLGVLALVNGIANKTKHLNAVEVTACSDNENVLKNAENDVKKRESEYCRGWGNS